jgi:hypothetical protein
MFIMCGAVSVTAERAAFLLMSAHARRPGER